MKLQMPEDLMPFDFRQAVRSGQFRGPTAGYCGDHAQANLAILPSAHASDFLRFCQANPKPCPLLGVGEPGQWHVPVLGREVDIRNDVPAYNIYRDGRLAEQTESLADLWQNDFVVFAIGCSFSFEHMLGSCHDQAGRAAGLLGLRRHTPDRDHGREVAAGDRA
ncbi:hypothetical protein OR16_29049 [Cupriavidus basilensis OR16]|uniref:DUF1445 domain-containing protein n=1 Tax=Cupriavidus basilensis OR16 TaxID=1127483 RepID=H1SC78_9BURK|nr:hypothetical protein OR16_29049 [Cupriavidus basilensis OR16]